MLTEEKIKEKLAEVDKLYPGKVKNYHRALELLGLHFGLLIVLETLKEEEWTKYITHLKEN